MTKVDHFAFEVSDMDAAIRFYTETLGLKLLSRDLDEDHHEAFAFLELEGGNLELLQVLDENNRPVVFEKQEITQSHSPHLAIETEDMDRLISTLEKKGVPIVDGSLEITGKVRWVYISDSDNNIVEFIQWL